MMSRLILLITLFAPVAAAQQEQTPRAQFEFFEKHIRPVLASRCVKCHGAKKQESSLRLDSREAMLRGGETAAAIVPGKPDESLLMEAIRYDGYEMPPDEQLPQSDVRNFAQWIATGAAWPDDSPIREADAVITDEDRDWWAVRPLTRPELPEGSEWCRNEIDRFVQARMAEQGITPAPQAEKHVLIRRLYFDLIGLPPTPQEVESFESDPDPAAWENLVDRLLASPRYGEHWARHWLDVVRYAESDGWNQDAYRPHIWRYRDYVVKSFNSDKPWPDFVRQQLAGDELPGDDPENLAATGFLRLGIYEYNQRDARGQWNDIMNEMTDVAGDVFLGVGMACARCHDHKFDPLLQKDYFRLRAFFEPIEWRDDLVYATAQQKEQQQRQVAAFEAEADEVLAEMNALLKPYYDRKWKSTVAKFPLDIQACFNKPVDERTSWEHQMAYLVSRQFEEEGGGPLKSMKKPDKARYEELKKKLAALGQPKPLPAVMAVTDFRGRHSPTTVQDSEEEVQPGFLTVMTSTTGGVALPDVDGSSGRRSALADWITGPENGLTHRVIVNRVWQYHFGRGLVSTPNDFGHLGQSPTHPQLLDWLACTFIEDGWSMKRLHKRVLMSATWQQSAHHPRAAEFREADPGETLLWRSRVRRLTAEQIRDAMLTVTGEMSHSLGGPSVDLKKHRRSLYLRSLRNTPNEFLHAFDVANGLKSVAERNSTTTPTQALMMINGSYPLARARAFGRHLISQEHETTGDAIDAAFQAAFGRSPADTELHEAAEYLRASPSDDPAKLDAGRLTDFCHILFNSSEFLYVD